MNNFITQELGGSTDGTLSGISPIPVFLTTAFGGNIAATTAATGTNWTTLSTVPLKAITVSNQTGTTIEVRQGGAGTGFQIPTATLFTFKGITNANQLSIRRVDTSNTQVTVSARWEN